MLAYAFHDVTMPQLAALCHAFGDGVGKASRWLERTRRTRGGRGRYFTKGHFDELYSGNFVVDMTKKPRRFPGNKKKVVIKTNSKVSFWGGSLAKERAGFLYQLFDSVMIDDVEVGIRNFYNQPVLLRPGVLTPVELIAKRNNKQVSGARTMEIAGPSVFADLFDFMTNLDDWYVPTTARNS